MSKLQKLIITKDSNHKIPLNLDLQISLKKKHRINKRQQMRKTTQKVAEKLSKSLQQLFADRQNLQFLKIQNFRRMLTDAQLLQSNRSAANNFNEQLKQIDILYSHTKKNNSGINFQNFLEILPQISKILYKDNYENGMMRMVNQNFHALYQFIYQSTEIGQCIRYFSKSSFSQNCLILLRHLSPTLYRIYDYYFDVNSLQVIKQRSQIFKKITVFTKNFEITPQMLTKTQSFLAFNYILNQQKLAQSAYKQWFQQASKVPLKSGKKNINLKSTKSFKNVNESRVVMKSNPTFSYFSFIQYILLLSLIGSRKTVGAEMMSNFRKLINFLQILEVSDGFSKLCQNQKINLHLTNIDENLIKQLEQQQKQQASSQLQRSLENSKDQLYVSFGKRVFDTLQTRQSNLGNSRYSKKSQQNRNNENSLNNGHHGNSDNIDQKIIQSYSILHNKFIQFCLFGQTIGSSSLTHKKIIDIVKAMQLGLKQSQIEVHIASINRINKKTQAEMDGHGSRRVTQKIKSKCLQFQQFIQLIQRIAQKLNVPVQTIIGKIINIQAIQSHHQSQDQNQTSYKFKLVSLNHNQTHNAPNIKLSRTQYRNCIAMVQILQDFLKAAFMLEVEPATMTPASNNYLNSHKTNKLKPTTQIPMSKSNMNNNYKNLDTNMTFISLNSYLKILHEFELTPLYLTKHSIIQIFRKSIKKSYDFMSFSEFKDSFIIGVAYYDVGYQQTQTGTESAARQGVEKKAQGLCRCKCIRAQTKLIIIFERINESRGASKICRSYPSFSVNKQDNLSKFRKLFSEFYPQNMDPIAAYCQCYCSQSQELNPIAKQSQNKQKQRQSSFRDYSYQEGNKSEQNDQYSKYRKWYNYNREKQEENNASRTSQRNNTGQVQKTGRSKDRKMGNGKSESDNPLEKQSYTNRNSKKASNDSYVNGLNSYRYQKSQQSSQNNSVHKHSPHKYGSRNNTNRYSQANKISQVHLSK